MNPEQLKLHFRRFELKYPLSLDQYRLIRPLVARRLSPDPFVGSAGYYQVNSLYFDTPNLNAYHQSRAGLKNRIKYRLRTYSTAIPAPPYAFLEIKRKHDATVLKDRDLLSLAQVDQLLAHQSNSQNSVIKQFTLAQTRYFLQPKILLTYRREPFVTELPELRITFDSRMQVTRANRFDQLTGGYYQIFPQVVIMELKFTGSLPFWLAQLIGHYNLERQVFSKYALGIERAKSYLPWIIS
ncbi:MAG: hypothetical protein A2784_00110 [Candidatus Chisholmbacteria bacterium RIFCSPHIGHO2_01_FULL_48_12]|uniref:VTC domain-containing protein n=1 Tax=Candidatus Chisholmbacteria bacterium RIFCSPHIGHO2_01_FULL_48_12 TaxID=1797589 RepID=A0A1G1VUQ9_9BACT|nr:MAG: hypothetical protein A2784_00110 [Candidatus Chisholmbacteria bacterium RIFCSPHIGHO2_01_FULL_48_12]